MPQFARDDVLVSLPEYYTLTEPSRTRRTPSLPPGPVQVVDAPTAEQDELLRGLVDARMDVVEISAVPTPSASERRSAGVTLGIEQPMRLQVPLEPRESAAVLLEQDGFYSWATQPTESVIAPATIRRSGAPAARLVTFSIEIHSSESASRSLQSFVFGKVRVLVLRFFTRAATELLVDWLERDVKPSLVRIGGSSITSWQPVDTLAALGVDTKPSPRILLFVHGTFSSTRNAFGALPAAPRGPVFLDAAVEKYDAVIGYDHRTLSEDPRKNAEALLQALRNSSWNGTPQFDVITHSRGGLVFRSLTEQVLPSSGFNANFKNAVFVGVPNGGTELARKENWRDLINLYTNGVAMLFRLISGLMPTAAPIASGFAEAITILASLVKHLADAGTSEIVPGLQAQVPNEKFIEALNRKNPGQPAPSATFYTWLGSDFEAKVGAGKPWEMPPRLWQIIADGFVDRLMKNKPNDLVVDLNSMSAVDLTTGGFIKEEFTFGSDNARVYHANYFAQPETVNRLAHWLQIPMPEEPVPTAVAPSWEPDMSLQRDTKVFSPLQLKKYEPPPKVDVSR